ncbi:haloacid dehalogenase-like hydrolase [Neiella marina]|uniref:Haloacid dehalogenase-like hydrolase n=1 Tax=Neiella holothuriorum TaxID=2870530 RepID=A0ABS7EGW8_9GAMM|nr:haloacid dehalogenase-like hydrolase [Neiella holothuriorum]MBW8191459.1 haloacid dehalogenase-like hydrolase [Neiella holothuriorum]
MMQPSAKPEPSEVKTSQQLAKERFEHSPSEVLHKVASRDDDCVALVDFDETLWLRNSTETFLASIQPSFIVAMLLQLLNVLKPWKWYGGSNSEYYREVMRLKVVLAVLPWARKNWQEQAPKIAKKHLNLPLYDALLAKGPEKIHVVSYGFDFIVEPLLAAIDSRLKLSMISTLDTAVALRRKGKAQATIDVVGELAMRNSICITDSMLDHDLLAKSTQGLLCEWPDAEFVQAGLSPMLPLLFTKKVNRPREKYISRVILGHDYVLMLLAFAVGSSAPIKAAVSLLLFIIAFFAIYETGYFENDTLGLKLEEKPRVAPEFIQYGDNFKPWFAWLCGLFIAIPAAGLASMDVSWLPAAIGVNGTMAWVAVWCAFALFMLAVRGVFYWFNRTPTQGRLIPMLLLQLARNCGLMLLFSTSLVGALCCLAWALGKWFPYIIYRFNGSAMGYPNHLVSGLLLLSMLAVVAGANNDLSIIWQSPEGLIILGYMLIRSAKDLWNFRAQLKPLVAVR